MINKVDTKAKTEVDKVESLIKKTLSEEGLPVKAFIRFSAKASLDDIMHPIKSVVHNDERENYLGNLEEYVSKWVAEQEKKVVDANKYALELLNKSNNLVDKYNESIKNLNDHCETVFNIPHYEVHLFRKDNYEMTQLEYTRMTNLLQIICEEDSKKLCDLYNQQMDKRAELQEAWNDQAREREQWKRLNQTYETLKKKIKELKKQ